MRLSCSSAANELSVTLGNGDGKTTSLVVAKRGTRQGYVNFFFSLCGSHPFPYCPFSFPFFFLAGRPSRTPPDEVIWLKSKSRNSTDILTNLKYQTRLSALAMPGPFCFPTRPRAHAVAGCTLIGHLSDGLAANLKSLTPQHVHCPPASRYASFITDLHCGGQPACPVGNLYKERHRLDLDLNFQSKTVLSNISVCPSLGGTWSIRSQ